MGENELKAVESLPREYTLTTYPMLEREELRWLYEERRTYRIRSRELGLWAVFHPDGHFLWWEGECEGCGGTAVNRTQLRGRMRCAGCVETGSCEA